MSAFARSQHQFGIQASHRPGQGIDFKVIDDPSIDTTSRTGKLVMGILALIAEFDMEHGRLEAQLRFFGSAFLVL
jgi:DNA invertase Pin-like site-specific DNA recombinase